MLEFTNKEREIVVSVAQGEGSVVLNFEFLVYEQRGVIPVITLTKISLSKLIQWSRVT